MKFTISPLTSALWPALEDLFDTQGPVNRCWCMYWRLGDGYRRRPRDANKAALCELVKDGPRRACSPSTATWPSAGAS